MKGDHQFKLKPVGSTTGGYARPRVQVGFEDGQIEAIAKRAKFYNRSFAAEVRALVTIGLTLTIDDTPQ